MILEGLRSKAMAETNGTHQGAPWLLLGLRVKCRDGPCLSIVVDWIQRHFGVGEEPQPESAFLLKHLPAKKYNPQHRWPRLICICILYIYDTKVNPAGERLLSRLLQTLMGFFSGHLRLKVTSAEATIAGSIRSGVSEMIFPGSFASFRRWQTYGGTPDGYY